MNKYLTPREYLPHEPPMVLIDEVVYVDDNKAITRCYVNHDGVLSPFLNDNDDLPAFFALEIFAQSVGVWNGFNQQGTGNKTKMGMVLGARDLKVKDPFFKAGSVLNIEVYKNMSDGTLANFEGKIFVNKPVDVDIVNAETADIEIADLEKEEQTAFASGRVNVISISDEDKHRLFNRE